MIIWLTDMTSWSIDLTSELINKIISWLIDWLFSDDERDEAPTYDAEAILKKAVKSSAKSLKVDAIFRRELWNGGLERVPMLVIMCMIDWLTGVYLQANSQNLVRGKKSASKKRGGKISL